MCGQQPIVLGYHLGNWIHKLIAGTAFVLINIAADSATAADFSKLECHKVKVNSDPYDTATAYVCRPKTKITTTNNVKHQKPSLKKPKLANNTNSIQNMELGKIYPAPKANKPNPKKTIKKNSPTKTVAIQTSRPIISFNYDLNHRDYQINSLRKKTAEPKSALKIKESVNNSKLGHPYMSVLFGASFAKIGKTQWDNTTDAINGCYQYKSTNGYKFGAVYGINGGYEFKLKNNFLVSFGVGVYQTTDLSSSGVVYYTENYPPTNKEHRFNYEYKVRSTRFMAETQLAWKFKRIIPFIALGFGPSINFVNNYEEETTSNHLTAPGFKSHTETNLAYQIGLGTAFSLNNSDRLILAYKYSNLGSSRFDSRNKTSLDQLETGKIKTNEIYVGYTHLFDF